MDSSRWVPLPYLIGIGALALTGASWVAATQAAAVWNDVLALNLVGVLRDLQGAFLLAMLALGCAVVWLLETSLRQPVGREMTHLMSRTSKVTVNQGQEA
jgi:hypothetical protein